MTASVNLLLFVLAAAAALTLAFLFFFFLFPFLLASLVACLLGWRTGNYRVAVWHTLLGLAIVCTSSCQKRGSEELSERVFSFPAAVAAII